VTYNTTSDDDAAGAVFGRLAALGVVPVVEIEDAASAVPLAKALRDGGLPAMEVTFRTEQAERAVAQIAATLPDFLLGAGTLLTADQVRAAERAGARFGVSPGCTDAIAEAAQSVAMPFIPGATTASEVMRSIDAGFRRIKFFPAERSGGTPMIAALSAPLAKTSVTFMPTGGVNLDNLSDYLAVPTVFAVGGTWIAPRASIAGADWATITARAAAAVAAVRANRENVNS
jgi:2-dehydro-3-deoxyphosphogluconate aldolase/(4S)-4-hydroxy-2-oxoglutarate aldolase